MASFVLFFAAVVLPPGIFASSATYTIPAVAPPTAAPIAGPPVGISYEFFTFPSYHSNVTGTTQCEKNLRDEAGGAWPPIRIGGTTQDRATFDPNLSGYVSYSVASDKDAPKTLKYGPRFMELAGQYEGSVVLGLNRGHNNVQNTVQAAKVAKSAMKNLLAIEMGNEPEYFKNDGQAIASGTWNSATDAASQATWQITIGREIGSLIQASNSLQNPPQWGAEQLASQQNSTALGYIKSFSHHHYPGGDIKSLMSHSNVVRNVGGFKKDVEVAKGLAGGAREYVFGETNSATGGGAAAVSPSFGAGLWVADHILQSVSKGISRLYFHHGTIGACQYCWWGRYSMGAPYYGAIFAAAATGRGAKSIVPIDKGDAFGAYAVFGESGTILRIILINSEYFSGSGNRGEHTFVLTGLSGADDKGSVSVKRLTAKSAGSRVDKGENPTWGGQTFKDGSCEIVGTEVKEEVKVSGGRAEVRVLASEATIVYL